MARTPDYLDVPYRPQREGGGRTSAGEAVAGTLPGDKSDRPAVHGDDRPVGSIGGGECRAAGADGCHAAPASAEKRVLAARLLASSRDRALELYEDREGHLTCVRPERFL